MKFSSKCVLLMFISIYIFTGIMIWCYIKTGGVPPELIISFFGWHGIEGGALALIKTVKTKNGGNCNAETYTEIAK